MLKQTPRFPLVLILLLTACAVVDSISGGILRATRWAEGLVRGEGEVVDDMQQGEWTFYDDAGNLRSRGEYVDDAQQGPWTYWYANGNKEHEGSFENRRRVGIWRYWHPNGNPRTQGRFFEGREIGEWTFWSTRGQITQRGSFYNGQQTGFWEYWNENGKPSASGIFLEGQKVGSWTIRGTEGEENQTWHGWPEGYAFVRESWPEGGVRREGFLLNGRQHGLWVSRHRTGSIRMLGTFENGAAHGPWTAYLESGEAIAEGQVQLGRPSGSWTVQTGSGPTNWNGDGSSPPPPFSGEWSRASLADSANTDQLLGTWLAESSAPIGEGSKLATTAPEAASLAEDAESLLAEVEVEPDVPMYAQPWTQRQLDEYQEYVSGYEGESVSPRLTSRYANRGGARGGPSTKPESETDSEQLGARFLGKPLPLTVYKDQSGRDVDLTNLRDKKVIVVVLRGFGGGVCVYCTAQTRAFCSAGAFSEFERLGAELQVVFPGPKNGLDAFRRGYEALNEEELPPYGLLYENDYIVSSLLDLDGSKVRPATFIIDEQGIVRFAYVGKHKADRPTVKRVIEALEEMSEGS